MYFRRIGSRNIRRVRQRGPMILAINHPNAFMDPMVVSWFVSSRRNYYMARGDAFNNPFSNWFLRQLGLFPIFRSRDGKFADIKKNLESFKEVYKLLDQNKSIILFVEGLCVQERRLRPVKKGPGRMALSYLDHGGNPELKILPLGIYYSQPSKKGGDVFFDVGEPISVAQYLSAFRENPNQGMQQLTARIQSEMEKVVPSLQHPENDQIVEQLQEIVKPAFLKEKKLNPSFLRNHITYWNYIINKLNQITVAEPGKIEHLRNIIQNYALSLQSLKLSDESIARLSKKQKLIRLSEAILLIVGFLPFLFARVISFLSDWTGSVIAKRKVKKREFKGSFHFTLSSLLLQIIFPIELALVYCFTQQMWWVWVYGLTKIIAIFYAPRFWEKTQASRSALRIFLLKKHQKAGLIDLIYIRNEIFEHLLPFD